jgi:hypothetical protein
MSVPMSFWPEVRRAFARWTGVVLASVLSGLLLGILRDRGIAYKLALEIAVPVGFLLALLFWIWLSREFPVTVAAPVPLTISPNSMTFDGELTFVYSYQVPAMPPTFAGQGQGSISVLER